MTTTRREPPAPATPSSLRLQATAARLRGRIPLPAALALLSAGWALNLTMAFVPAVRDAIGFDHPAAGFALCAVASLASLAESLFWERPRVRAAMRLAGPCAWCCAFIAFALTTPAPARYVFAVVYWQMAVFYGRHQPLSVPSVLAMGLVPLLLSLAAWPHLGLTGLALIGAMSFVFTSLGTTREEQYLRANAKLESAYRTASQVATSSLDIALAMIGADVGSRVHQLRNRLTPVVAHLSLANSEPGLPDGARDSLARARAALLASCEQLDAVMAAARRRAARPDADFALAPVIDAVVASRREAVRCTVQQPLPAVALRGNPDHLSSVLENLVDNACEAGAKEVAIGATVLADAGHVAIALRDDGPGLPEALRDKLLQGPVDSEKSRGHGLGLYLSRRLVELLGGDLAIVETGPAGTAFRLVLPCRATDAGEGEGSAAATSTTSAA